MKQEYLINEDISLEKENYDEIDNSTYDICRSYISKMPVDENIQLMLLDL